jgi:hypothetical protein
MIKYLNLILVRKTDDGVIKSDNHHISSILDYLNKKYDYKNIFLDDLVENINNLNIYLTKKYGEYDKCNLLSFGGVCDFVNCIGKLSEYVDLGIIIVDMHHGSRINRPRKIVFEKCKYIFSTYAYHHEHYFPRHDKIYFFPHSTAYKIEFNYNPIKKILVSGHLNQSIYPNRELMAKQSKINKNIELFVPDYSGYQIKNKDLSKTFGIKYYQLLNSYLCCVADDSIIERRYIVAKFFEIIGSGSLLIAFNSNTKEVFGELGFIDKVHYFSMNKENYEKIIEYVLDDKNIDEINKIRLNGYEFVNKYHHYTNRAEYLNKIFTEQINNVYLLDSFTNTKYIKYELNQI